MAGMVSRVRRLAREGPIERSEKVECARQPVIHDQVVNGVVTDDPAVEVAVTHEVARPCHGLSTGVKCGERLHWLGCAAPDTRGRSAPGSRELILLEAMVGHNRENGHGRAKGRGPLCQRISTQVRKVKRASE